VATEADQLGLKSRLKSVAFIVLIEEKGESTWSQQNLLIRFILSLEFPP